MPDLQKMFGELTGLKMTVTLIMFTIGATIGTITWLNTNYVSEDKHATLVKMHEQVVENIKNEKQERERMYNKIRQDIKSVRIEELRFEQKLILSKREDELTDHDKRTLRLIELELRTFNASTTSP